MEQFNKKAALLSAIFNKEFEVYYQAQWSRARQGFISAEALIRWKTKNKVLAPASFMADIDAYGFLPLFGMYVFEGVCKDLNSLDEQGLYLTSVSVNFSYQQLTAIDIVEKIKKLLVLYQIQGARFCIEITETEQLEDISKVLGVIHQLKLLGMKISLDDFCTGYSCLEHLTLLPVNEIKLDRQFVQDIAFRSKAKALCSRLIAMAKKNGVSTVAEGVETNIEAEYLLTAGVDKLQGYFFSKPIPVHSFAHFLGHSNKLVQLIA